MNFKGYTVYKGPFGQQEPLITILAEHAFTPNYSIWLAKQIVKTGRSFFWDAKVVVTQQEKKNEA